MHNKSYIYRKTKISYNLKWSTCLSIIVVIMKRYIRNSQGLDYFHVFTLIVLSENIFFHVKIYHSMTLLFIIIFCCTNGDICCSISYLIKNFR
ncbi:hypothetical protein ACJX0J_037480, partial [Zea mays]